MPRGRRGVVSLEFALVAGILFIMLLAAIDLGRYYMTLQGMRNFVADANRYAMVSMTAGQRLCRSELLDAVGCGGAVGGLVSTGVCAERSEVTANSITTITVAVTADVTFSFVILVFGVGTQHLRDSTRRPSGSRLAGRAGPFPRHGLLLRDAEIRFEFPDALRERGAHGWGRVRLQPRERFLQLAEQLLLLGAAALDGARVGKLAFTAAHVGSSCV